MGPGVPTAAGTGEGVAAGPAAGVGPPDCGVGAGVSAVGGAYRLQKTQGMSHASHMHAQCVLCLFSLAAGSAHPRSGQQQKNSNSI